MQRPMLDDHAVIEETIEQCILAERWGSTPSGSSNITS